MAETRPKRVPATVHIWCGAFASQDLVFAHLMDCGMEDLDRIEVIAPGEEARLRHFGVLEVPRGAAGTLVLDVAKWETPMPFEDTEHLTYLGAFAGRRYE